MANLFDIPVYECPADGCDWKLSQLDYERNRPPLRAKVTFDAAGAIKLDMDEAVAADAKHIDKLLRGHLETHDIFVWVRTVVDRDQRLYQYENPTGVRPHAYDFLTGGHIG